MIDLDAQRLALLSGRFDVRTVEGDGRRKQVVTQGRRRARPTCSSAAARARRPTSSARCSSSGSRGAQTIIRTTSGAYLEAWREREIDVDFMVSPELETANAIVGDPRHPGRAPHRRLRRRQGADRRVRRARRRGGERAGRACRCASAAIPADSRVAGLDPRRPHDRPARRRAILPGDRIVVDRLAGRRARVEPARGAAASERVDDVVIFGAGRMGTTIARVLLERGMRMRLVDATARARRRGRARAAGRARLPRARVRPRVPRARADRPRDRRRLRAQRRRQEPLRRRARQGPRRAHDDRARARPDVGRGLRARRRGRRDQPAPGHRGGDGPLRARPAHPPDRDARGRPLRGARPHGPRRVGSSSNRPFKELPVDGVADRRGDPQTTR